MPHQSEQSGNPKIGLALSGGAARGMAHVGVLRALEENSIPIDAIAGASAGALIGGAYAAGLTVAQLEALTETIRWRHMGRPAFSRLGFNSNRRMQTFLQTHLPVTRFEHLKIPLAVMTTDLKTGTVVVKRDSGDMTLAIRASCCVPGLYTPVTDEDGRLLTDGGLVANLPISHTRALGADIVIGVDVGAEGARFIDRPRTILGVLTLAFVAAERIVSNQEKADADVLIVPKAGHIRWDQTKRGAELVKVGYDAALASLDEIRKAIEEYRFSASKIATA